MLRNRALIAATAAALLAASGAAADAETDRADRLAAEVFAALRDEHTVRAVKSFDPALRADLSPSRLSFAWRRLESALGALRSWRADPAPAGKGRRAYLLELGSGNARATLAFSAQGLITGFSLSPVAAAPHATGAARSEEVAVGEGPLLVGGTLALPAGEGRRPAALLLGPMGPIDRDGGAGPRRPLRDLAEALAERGVVSLRFDKRSVAWPVRADTKLTIEAEVAADAVVALAQLRARPEVDPARIFVVGLGVGGTLAPEVASRDGQAAGSAVLSAPPHAWPLALLEQARATSPVGSAQVLKMERETARVMAGALRAEESFLGYPGSWWADLGARDAVSAALRFGRPVLFLRGERDTLVTADDLEVIRRAVTRLPAAQLGDVKGADGLFFPRDSDRVAPAASQRVADFILAAPPAPAAEPEEN